jgi:membrane protein YqaA with SNARE-associated domain
MTGAAPLVLSLSLETIIATLAGGFEALVESATGWPGVGIVFVYSFLIAFVLPGPSEIVLAAPLDLGLTQTGRLGVIMLVSATGKAAGSVLAFHVGQEVKRAGPVVRWLRRSRWDVMEWSETRSVQLAQRYGYAGLAAMKVAAFSIAAAGRHVVPPAYRWIAPVCLAAPWLLAVAVNTALILGTL